MEIEREKVDKYEVLGLLDVGTVFELCSNTDVYMKINLPNRQCESIDGAPFETLSVVSLATGIVEYYSSKVPVKLLEYKFTVYTNK